MDFLQEWLKQLVKNQVNNFLILQSKSINETKINILQYFYLNFNLIEQK